MKRIACMMVLFVLTVLSASYPAQAQAGYEAAPALDELDQFCEAPFRDDLENDPSVLFDFYGFMLPYDFENAV